MELKLKRWRERNYCCENLEERKKFLIFATQKEIVRMELNENAKFQREDIAPMHTAEHLLNQTMIRMFGCERSKNAHVERKKSKINYNLTECPTAEQVEEIERRMNDVIGQNLPVTYEIVNRADIPKGVALDKLPDDAGDVLRIVRIGDYDTCVCIGKHVESTKEIGTFKITSTSYNEGSFRIVFKVVKVEV